MNTYQKFYEKATNIYRTRRYIVKQRYGIITDTALNAVSFSFDVFYLRTEKRDLEYTLIFAGRMNIDGRRVPTMMYSRSYLN